VDIDIVRGLALIGLIVGFFGIVFWAWSRKRKPEFDRAAKMPLEEDAPAEEPDPGQATTDRRTED
jgi:cytochrome c oxidase cbb3-type subunit 4